MHTDTLVDNKDPITFEDLARRFTRQGMTADAYNRRFKLPLAFDDIMNPTFADEIVGYRCLIDWYRHGRPALPTSKQPLDPATGAGLNRTTSVTSYLPTC